MNVLTSLWLGFCLLHVAWVGLWIFHWRHHWHYAGTGWTRSSEQIFNPPQWWRVIALNLLGLIPFFLVVLLTLQNFPSDSPLWIVRGFIEHWKRLLSPLCLALSVVFILLGMVAAVGQNGVYKKIGDPVGCFFLVGEYIFLGGLIQSF